MSTVSSVFPSSQHAVFSSAGEKPTLSYGSFPSPAFDASSGDILIKIHASSVNPLDWKQWAYNFLNFTKPFALGWDFSGVIAAVGAKAVGGWKVGDEVFSYAPFNASGTYAEWVVVDGLRLAHKPAGVPHEQVAALPIAFGSAYDGIINLSQLLPGKTVLISGAAGGVGHFAVQLAKLLGATVFAFASNDSSAKLVKSLGADHIINYKTQNVQQEVFKLTHNVGVDVVFDPTAGVSYELSATAVKEGGRFVGLEGVVPPADKPFWSVLAARKVPKENIVFADTVSPSTFHPHKLPAYAAVAFTYGAELIRSGKLKVHIEKTLKLGEEVVEEMKAMQAGKSQIGKVVVKP